MLGKFPNADILVEEGLSVATAIKIQGTVADFTKIADGEATTYVGQYLITIPQEIIEWIPEEINTTSQFTSVADSGKRQEFETGSVRDTREGKGRYDLIPYEPHRRLAVHYENGAKKYGDRNWEKGQNLMRFLDSATRHLEELKAGFTNEDHAAAAIWNLYGFIATQQWIKEGKLPKELDDFSGRLK